MKKLIYLLAISALSINCINREEEAPKTCDCSEYNYSKGITFTLGVPYYVDMKDIEIDKSKSFHSDINDCSKNMTILTKDSKTYKLDATTYREVIKGRVLLCK
ncbi:MAG: hypothetical protein ACRC8Z_03655 [Empedobacter falsenii]